jgi:transposase
MWNCELPACTYGVASSITTLAAKNQKSARLILAQCFGAQMVSKAAIAGARPRLPGKLPSTHPSMRYFGEPSANVSLAVALYSAASWKARRTMPPRKRAWLAKPGGGLAFMAALMSARIEARSAQVRLVGVSHTQPAMRGVHIHRLPCVWARTVAQQYRSASKALSSIS